MAQRGQHISALDTSLKIPETRVSQKPRLEQMQGQLAQTEEQNRRGLVMAQEELKYSKPSPKSWNVPKTNVDKSYYRSEHFQAHQQITESPDFQTQMMYPGPQVEIINESTGSTSTGDIPQNMSFNFMVDTPPTSNYYQGSPTNNRTLQDYEAQLILLELQNKKRLMMTTRCQEPATETGESSTGVNPTQLRHIEQETTTIKSRHIATEPGFSDVSNKEEEKKDE